MQNGPLHNIRLNLMILEAFCNLNDSMVTQYQPQKSYQKNYKPEIHFWHCHPHFSSFGTPLTMSEQEHINKRHQTQQQVLFWMYSGEKEKKILNYFSNTWENIQFDFSKALNIPVIIDLMKPEALLRHTMSEGKKQKSCFTSRVQTCLGLGINNVTCGDAEWQSLKPCLQHNFLHIY